MSSQVIQFQCTACQAHLTVPAHLAGVTGPCPKCGQSITSPAAPATAPAPAPAFPQQPASIPPAAPASTPWTNAPAAASAPMPSPLPAAPPAAAQPPGSPPAAVWTNSPPPAQPAAPAASTLLPPRQDQPPAAPASLPGGLQAPATAAQPAATSLPPRSSLIPGAPVLPTLETPATGAQGGPANGSLLNSLLGSPGAPAPATSPATPATITPEVISTPAVAPAPVEAAQPAPAISGDSLRQPLPPFPKKPGRGSNLARFGIAVILLLSCVALLGYVGRQPLREFYTKHVAKLWQANPEVVESATEEPPSPVESPLPEDPTVPLVEKTEPAVTALNPPMPGQLAPGDPLPEPPPSAPATTVADTPSLPAVPPTPPETDADEPMTEIKRAAPALPGDLADATLAPAPKPVESLMEVPSATATSAVSSSAPALTVPDEAKPAAEALMEFLSSDSLDGKRKFILGINDPQINALVERYYGQADPGAIPITSISLLRHDPNPEVGGGMQSVFMVASPDWTYPIPVMLQETKQGFKLDWIAFIEFKDSMLLKFVQAYRDNPSRFHVSIKRSHYFDRDVPDLENKDCFIIQPPQEDFEVSVFVPKNTPLADKLRRDLSWNTQFAYVLAEIQWRDDGTHQWIELTAVPQLNWYITTETPGAAQEAK